MGAAKRPLQQSKVQGPSETAVEEFKSFLQEKGVGRNIEPPCVYTHHDTHIWTARSLALALRFFSYGQMDVLTGIWYSRFDSGVIVIY